MPTMSDLFVDYMSPEEFAVYSKLFTPVSGKADVSPFIGADIVLNTQASNVWPIDKEGYNAAYLTFSSCTFGSALKQIVRVSIYYKEGMTFNVEKLPPPLLITPEALLANAKDKTPHQLSASTSSKYPSQEEKYYIEKLPQGGRVDHWLGFNPKLAFDGCTEVSEYVKRIYRVHSKEYVPAYEYLDDILHPTEKRYLSREELGRLAGQEKEAPRGHWSTNLIPNKLSEFIARQVYFCVTGAWKGKNFSTTYEDGFFSYVAVPQKKLKTYIFEKYGVA